MGIMICKNKKINNYDKLGKHGGIRPNTAANWPTGLKILPKGPIFVENGPFGNCFPRFEEMNKTFWQGNEIGKVIKEQVWTK